MSDLYKDASYLRAVLKEAVLDINVRQYSAHGSKPVLEILRDARILETLLLLLDRVDVLEGKPVTSPEPDTKPKFEDRSFIVEYAGETLCKPDDRRRAESLGYEVVGTYAALDASKPYFKLARVNR